MNREVHVRFCERFRGANPLYLLDFFVLLIVLAKTYFFAILGGVVAVANCKCVWLLALA